MSPSSTGALDVFVGTKSVVVDDLRFTIGVGVENGAHVAEAVPLR
jgi:hypothetical protein